MEPSPPLRQRIEEEVNSLLELAESEDWWDEDKIDRDEALPIQVNPRHTGGRFDGNPGDVILVAITDIIPTPPGRPNAAGASIER